MQKLFSWLLGLYIFSHVTSTAGQELFSGLLFVLCLFILGKEVLKNKNYSVLNRLQTGANWPLFGFLAWAVMGAVYHWSATGNSNLYQTLRELRWILIFISFAFLMRYFAIEKFERHFKAAMIACVIVGVYGLIQMFYPIDIVRGTTAHLSPYGDYFRATGFFNIALTYAYCLGMLGLFGVAYLFTHPNGPLQNYALIASVATGFGLIASNTRGAWLAAIAAIICLAALSPRKVAVRIVAAMALVCLAVMMDPSFRRRAISIVDVTKENSNLERIGVWKANVAMIKDNPIIGVGLEGSKSRLSEYYDILGIKSSFISHSHNDLLDITSGTGFPGLVFYLWFCFFFLKMAYTNWRDATDPNVKSLALGTVLAQVYFHVGGLTQCNFNDNEVNHVLIFVWALTLGIKELNKRSYSPSL